MVNSQILTMIFDGIIQLLMLLIQVYFELT